jgi:uncharacterized protein (DUF305 family)
MFRRNYIIFLSSLLSAAALVVAVPRFLSAAPGVGLTSQFEINFLEFTIDHHFSALRMTELAAGTDSTRNAAISPTEGTSPTPGYAATTAKADIADLKSLARRENRTQREEILMAQTLLKQWYGITYTPRVLPENQTQIDLLENSNPGGVFDVNFMTALSRHHYTIIQQASACLVSADLNHLHASLERYCRNIVNSQLSDTDEMRHILCNRFHICDYQPLTDPQGSFTQP